MEKCPFCGGQDIRYSLKGSERFGRRTYHACFYCWDCNAYGPRVSYIAPPDVYRHEVEHNDALKQAAAEKWNKRG